METKFIFLRISESGVGWDGGGDSRSKDGLTGDGAKKYGEEQV
jgi:hypothetical protein